MSGLLRRTNDDFGVTLAGNPIGKYTTETLVKIAQEVHAQRVGADHVDPQMGLRRVAF